MGGEENLLVRLQGWKAVGVCSDASGGHFLSRARYALRAACVPPTKNPSPVARIFGVSRKKYQKTPFETKVSKLPSREEPLNLRQLIPRGRIGMWKLPLNVA